MMEIDAATSDDSDATVAGEEDTSNAPDLPRFPPLDSSRLSEPIATNAHAQSQEEAAAHLTQSSSRASDGEDTGPVSPSLLSGYDASKGHGKNSDHDMEIVPNSSGEGSTCDEEMSQEIPLQAVDMKCKATVNKTETRNPVQCHEDAQSLSSVIQDQEYLISYLSTLNKPSPAVVSKAKKKATVLEENLKVANLSNQRERKRLAAAHNSLLSQCLSQEELSQGSLPLKAQLLQLATRQKQLLECFKKQKEINLMLTKFEEAIQAVSTGHGCSNPSQVPSMGVSRVGRVETKSSLNGGGVQVMKGQVTVPNPPTLAAALPNLVRHLQQPVGERGETRLQIPPTVVVSASNPSQTTSSSTRNQLANVSIISASQSRPSHTMQQPQTVLSSNSQSMTNKSSNVQVPSMNKQLLSDSGGVAAAKAPLSSTDLSQPVPLPDLIKQGFIKPGVDCISCLIMGCEFKASLLEDGSIKDHLGAQHQHPQQWYRSCWAKLGHAQKKPTRKSAYTSVFYHGLPLLHFCEKYSLKQVNSYLIEKDKRKSLAHPTNDSAVLHTSTSCIQENDGMPQNTFHVSAFNMSSCHTTVITNEGTCSCPGSVSNTVSVSGPLNWVLCGIDDTLWSGRLLLHSSSKQTSLELPSEFWSGDRVDLSEMLCQQIEQDLQW